MEIIAQTLDLDKVCRVCLFESNRMYSIFSALYEDTSNEESSSIYEMLISISNIKIQLNDGLPSLICTKCIYNALNSYKFQKQCNKAQAILDNYVIQLESFNPSEDTNISISEQFISSSENDFVDSMDITTGLSPKQIDINTHVSETFKDENFEENDTEELNNDVFCDVKINDDDDEKSEEDSQNCDYTLENQLISVSNLEEENSTVNKQKELKVEPVKQKKTSDGFAFMKYYSKQLESGKRVYACNLCDKVYQYSNSLKIHIKNHSEERPYVCNSCGKNFKHLQALIYHQRSHTGEQPYSCNICGKKYRQSGTLTAHMRVHTGARPFLCSICGRGFRQAPDLTYHMRTHTKEKPYMCNVCGKTMSMQSHLVQHMRTHTGERPFQCSVCDKAFPSSTRLKRHAIIHTGLKPYQCEVCEKSFNRKSTLFVHSKIHTDERPHVCPICNKGFIQGHALRSHIITHSSTIISLQKAELIE